MKEDTRGPDPGEHRLTRRRFIRGTGAAGAGAVAAGVIPPRVAAAGTGRADYPVKPIVELSALAPGTTVPFTYPDDRAPALLLRMNEAALGGVGPDSSIVAFSTLCTHKGCPVAYRPEHRLLICPCHWSSFDPAKAGGLSSGRPARRWPGSSFGSKRIRWSRPGWTGSSTAGTRTSSETTRSKS